MCVALLESLLFRRYYIYPTFSFCKAILGIVVHFCFSTVMWGVWVTEVAFIFEVTQYSLRIPPPTYINELGCVKCGLRKSPHVSAFPLTHMQILLQHLFYMNCYSNIIIISLCFSVCFPLICFFFPLPYYSCRNCFIVLRGLQTWALRRWSLVSYFFSFFLHCC